MQIKQRIIKSIFTKLAALPGLGLPHNDLEQQLMVARLKPTILISTPQIEEDMRKAIHDGRIVHIGDDPVPRLKKFRIYHHPADTAKTGKQGQHYAEFYAKGTAWGPAEDEKEREINFPVVSMALEGWEDKVDEFLKGKANLGFMLLDCDYTDDIDPSKLRRFDETVKKGIIKSSDFEYRMLPVSVYAQADKQAEGRELLARYYSGGEGYKKLSLKQNLYRIAELLGYTQSDASYFTGSHIYWLPPVRLFLYMTENYRRAARTRLMMEEIQSHAEKKAEHHIA